MTDSIHSQLGNLRVVSLRKNNLLLGQIVLQTDCVLGPSRNLAVERLLSFLQVESDETAHEEVSPLLFILRQGINSPYVGSGAVGKAIQVDLADEIGSIRTSMQAGFKAHECVAKSFIQDCRLAQSEMARSMRAALNRSRRAMAQCVDRARAAVEQFSSATEEQLAAAERMCEADATLQQTLLYLSLFTAHLQHETAGAVTLRPIPRGSAMWDKAAMAVTSTVSSGFFPEGCGLRVVEAHRIEHRVLASRFAQLSSACDPTQLKPLFAFVPVARIEHVLAFGFGNTLSLEDIVPQCNPFLDPAQCYIGDVLKEDSVFPLPVALSRHSTLSQTRSSALAAASSGVPVILYVVLCRALISDVYVQQHSPAAGTQRECVFVPSLDEFYLSNPEHILPEFLYVCQYSPLSAVNDSVVPAPAAPVTLPPPPSSRPTSRARSLSRSAQRESQRSTSRPRTRSRSRREQRAVSPTARETVETTEVVEQAMEQSPQQPSPAMVASVELQNVRRAVEQEVARTNVEIGVLLQRHTTRLDDLYNQMRS